ncbi:MAG TPA: hypothetical protein PKO06_23245 [Candidatus Ozemobacteraceae bacterium]|nr:hypothetical protein [Candidatus Ozemobacteraceae bacterium]
MKQKTFLYVFIALLAVSLFLIIGRQLIIAPLLEKTASVRQTSAVQNTQIESLNKQLANLKKDGVDSPQSTRLLPAGSEHQILQTIVSAASTTGFIVEALVLQPSFQKRNKPGELAESGGTPTLKPGELPPVDENGNAVGMTTEDDDNGPSVEIVPVRVQGKGALRAWGLFLRQIRQELPLFGFRELVMQYTSTEPKGSFEIVVPLKTAVQASSGLPQTLTGGK